MRNKILAAAVAALTLGGLAFGGATPASATVQEQPDTEPCYAQVPYTVYQFSKTTPAVAETFHTEYSYSKEVEKPTYGDVIEKETRIKTSNNWGITWSDWSEWTDWPGAGPVNDDGRDRGPAFHGQDNSGRDRWYREYRYVVVGQFQNGTTTETVYSGVVLEPLGEPWVLLDGYPKQVGNGDAVPESTVYYNDGNVGPDDLAVDGVRTPGWTTDQTLDRSWVQTRTAEFMKNGDQVPCSDQPKDKVTRTKWVDGTPECGDTTVEQTRIVTTTPYKLDDNFQWVLDTENAVSVTKTRTRDLTEEEQFDCPPIVVTPSATFTPPTCDAEGFVTLSESDGYRWITDKEFHLAGIIGYVYTALENEGYAIAGDHVFGPYVLAQLTGEKCEPPPTEPPTTEPPVTTVPTVPPTVPPATPPLAATGSDGTGNLIGLGIAALIAGGVALWASRRKKSPLDSIQ